MRNANASMTTERSRKIYILDLLCITPFYDRYLCNALQAVNHSIELCAISFHLDVSYFDRNNVRRCPGIIDIVAKLRIKNKRLRQGLKAIEYCINLIIFYIKCRLFRPDIVHIQWLPLITKLPFELWFLRMLKRTKVKLVYTAHNILPHDTGDKYKRQYNRVYQLFDAIVVHTRHSGHMLTRKFGIQAEHICIIPHGPIFHDSIQLEQSVARTRIGLDVQQNVVLFLGIIKPYKGLEFLLHAWEIVVTQCPKSCLIIAGNGDSNYLEAIDGLITKLKLQNHVKKYFYFIPNEELPFFYHAADIIVYPYKNITQSGALLTGMAFGKAIVASNINGFAETIKNGKTGVLADYEDVQSMSTHLINLIQSPDKREKLGKGALDDVSQTYSWDVVAAKTIECYKQIITTVI